MQCVIWHVDICINCIQIKSSYYCTHYLMKLSFFVVRTFQIYSSSYIEICNIFTLTASATFWDRSLNVFQLCRWNFVLFFIHGPLPLPFCSWLLWVQHFEIPHSTDIRWCLHFWASLIPPSRTSFRFIYFSFSVPAHWEARVISQLDL